MPSLNIKDYIIGVLLVLLLVAGITIAYDKTRMSVMTAQLDNVKLLQEEAARKSKLIEKRTEQERKESEESYQNKIASLNADVKRLRDSGTSVMPSITKATSDIKRITFQRDKLHEALDRYTNRIQGLVAEGAECEIKLNELKDWWYNIESLYAR